MKNLGWRSHHHNNLKGIFASGTFDCLRFPLYVTTQTTLETENMQILQGFFKASEDDATAATTVSSVRLGRSKREQRAKEETKANGPVLYDGYVASLKSIEENELDEDEVEAKKPSFRIQLKRNDDKSRFYSTLSLKHLKSLYDKHDMGLMAEPSNNNNNNNNTVGNKVLPVCEGAAVRLNGGKNADHALEQDILKGERRPRAMSRMKDLLRWAAAAKAHKGAAKGWKVLYLKSRTALKAQEDDASSNSSRISFRWDVGSCSASSSVYSPSSLASACRSERPYSKEFSGAAVNVHSNLDRTSTASDKFKEECVRRTGQWITTDSDFVVLEL